MKPCTWASPCLVSDGGLPAGPGDRRADGLGVPGMRTQPISGKSSRRRSPPICRPSGPGWPPASPAIRTRRPTAGLLAARPASAHAAMRISIVCSFFLPVPPVRGGAWMKIWFRLGREFAARGSRTLFSRTLAGFFRTGRSSRRCRSCASRLRPHPPDLAQPGARFQSGTPRRPPSATRGLVAATRLAAVHLFLTRPSAGRVVVVLSRMSKGHGISMGGSPAHRHASVQGRGRSRERPAARPHHGAAQSDRLAAPPRFLRKAGRPRADHRLCDGCIRKRGVDQSSCKRPRELARRPRAAPLAPAAHRPQRVSEGGGGEEHVEGLRRGRAAGRDYLHRAADL